jgi:hypothetical protein
MQTLKYKGPYPYHFDGQLEKSYMLRFLIHMVGDQHQPLHQATLCSPKHPTCDSGGCKFKINHPSLELHYLWDWAMSKDNIHFRKRV